MKTEGHVSKWEAASCLRKGGSPEPVLFDP